MRSIVVALSCVLAAPALSQPLTSAFTYQGELASSNTPANGLHDFQFALFDSAGGVTQIGPTLCADNISVENGRFIVHLDFGAQFNAQQRHLEVRVRPDTGLACANPAGFTTLGPRLPITATPAASFSLNAASAATATTAASATNSTNLNNQPASFYTNAANLTGNLPDARLSSNIPRLNAASTFTAIPAFNGGVSGSSAPFSVDSNSLVTNLNADLLDGLSAAAFAAVDHAHTGAHLTVPLSLTATDQAPALSATFTGGAGAALSGLATATSGENRGVYGEAAGDLGVGVHGKATKLTGLTFGVLGENVNPTGAGVYGRGAFRGVKGDTTSSGGIGVEGRSNGATGIGVSGGTTTGDGVRGEATSGYGVHGMATATSGSGRGVFGESAGSSGAGVYASTTHATGSTRALHAEAASTSGTAVYAFATAASGVTMGINALCESPSGYGVYATARTSGVVGETINSGGTGVTGYSNNGSGNGVFGEGFGGSAGVRGESSTGNAVVAISSQQDALYAQTSQAGKSSVFGFTNTAGANGGYFNSAATSGTGRGVVGQSNSASGFGLYSVGNTAATGTKSFQIDHPLDPANMYLQHYCAEGPEPLNVYRGTITLDDRGEAEVLLPGYFESINKDPSYTLTAVGAPMPMLHVSREVAGNRFIIAGGAPNAKVSWRIEATRNDAWVRVHGAPVEVPKPALEKGRYLHPELHDALPGQAILNPAPPALTSKPTRLNAPAR